MSVADAGGGRVGSFVAGVGVTTAGKTGGRARGGEIGSGAIVGAVVAILGCSHEGATVSRATSMPPRIAPITSVVVMTIRRAVCGGDFMC